MRNDWLVTSSGAVSPGLGELALGLVDDAAQLDDLVAHVVGRAPSRIAWRISANFDSASSVNSGSATRSGISTYSKWLR